MNECWHWKNLEVPLKIKIEVKSLYRKYLLTYYFINLVSKLISTLISFDTTS